MLCKAPSQLSQTEGTYILCVGTADRLKPSIDPCCDNHKDRNGQWSFLHEHSASPCPSLTATFSLTLFLTFISVPTPVTSCHSSTMFWSDQLANYSSSLVKGLKKDKTLISYLDQFLELGVFFWVGIDHGALLVLLCARREGFMRSTSNVHSWNCNHSSAPRGLSADNTAHPLSQGMSSDPSVKQL